MKNPIYIYLFIFFCFGSEWTKHKDWGGKINFAEGDSYNAYATEYQRLYEKSKRLSPWDFTTGIDGYNAS